MHEQTRRVGAPVNRRRWISHACGARWIRPGACHCAGCHETFTGISAFDAHRRDGKCHDPATLTNSKGRPVGLVRRQDASGCLMWGWPGAWKPEEDQR